MERMKVIGRIKPVSSLDVQKSKVGLGFEKLDRDTFDPEKAYDKAVALGVKWIRIQSGWAKTEKEKGVYDFAWLDSIVDNLVKRNLIPWMCLCYGNGLYTPMAREVYAGAGCPPTQSEEERQAWCRYVSACTAHFKGRVTWYEVWNEPDGSWCWKTGPDGKEYGEFVKLTAQAIREGDSSAKVMCGSFCTGNNGWLNDMFSTGAAAVSDAFTYHAYAWDEVASMDRIRTLFALCKLHNPKMRLVQGEFGAQSNSLGRGAYQDGAWTPERQAKNLLRHFVTDFRFDILFSSYFSCLDMKEALHGKVGDLASQNDYGYFGLLGARFGADGKATGEYTPKPAYYAMQNIASLFVGDFSLCDLPIQVDGGRISPRTFSPEPAAKELQIQGFQRDNGSCAYVYWNATHLMNATYDGTVTLQVTGLTEKMRLLDPMSGLAYEIPDSMIEANGYQSFFIKQLPLKDYPLFLTFGDFVPLV